MLEVEQARREILAHVSPMSVERVSLWQAAGRVLAQEVIAADAHPAFDQSAMDGYAVAWADVEAVARGERVVLAVTLEQPAGRAPQGALGPGQAARIMTGGALPEGADTVIMREDTDEADRRQVVILALPGAGRGAHIRRRGSHIGPGQRVLGPGAWLGGGELGLLASLGRAVVSVRRRPRVAILSTGDELVEVGQQPGPGQIVNSSGVMLASMVSASGGEPWLLPIARDDEAETLARFEEALAGADLVVSTGGVSVGDHDVVKAVLERLCGALSFWRVRMKPGKPLAFGVGRARPVPLIGVPGNPVSAWVSYWQFVHPAIRRALGARQEALPVVRAQLASEVRSTPGRLDFQRGRLEAAEGGGWRFWPVADQTSGNPLGIVEVDGLARVPVGVGRLEAGQEVEVEVLPRP